MWVTDCKAIPGEACLTQHRLVRADLKVVDIKRKKWKGIKKIKVWKLKDEDTRKEFEAKFSQKMRTCTGTWKQLVENVISVGKEVCGETSGKRGKERETWWWNDVVQQKLKEKDRAFKQWQQSRRRVDKRRYKIICKEACREIAIAKQRAWED